MPAGPGHRSELRYHSVYRPQNHVSKCVKYALFFFNFFVWVSRLLESKFIFGIFALI